MAPGSPVSVLGVTAEAVTVDDLHAAIERAVSADHRLLIGYHNLHSVYLFHRDARMRAFYSAADLVHIDGMPLVWLASLLGYPVAKEHRVTYVDWFPLLASMLDEKKWRLFGLGASPEVASEAEKHVISTYPGIQVRFHHGYFAGETGGSENNKVLGLIADFHPHVLLVGMGNPRQEIWTLANLDRLAANAVLMGGGVFDYFGGAVPSPPRWMGALGLEWLARLVAEPRRLGKRYLVEPWFLLPHLVADLRNRRRHRSKARGDPGG